MSKELEALQRLHDNITEGEYFWCSQDDEDKEIVETALKALEIIKDDILPLLNFDDNLHKVYATNLQYHAQLTQEEYDLLKEVLL